MYDPSSMIVAYNFVIGILVMLSSERLAAYAGYNGRSRKRTFGRVAYVSIYAFGACVAALSGSIYLLFHFLKLGV